MKFASVLKHNALILAILATAPSFAEKAAKVSNDSESAKILSTIIALDQNEILAGIEASHKKVSSDVADFAKMMIDQHGQNFGDAFNLANKIHALPLTGNSEMASKGLKELSTLAAKDGDDYDRAYVDAMVKGHEEALSIVENKLMKMAKNSDLKTFLSDTKDAISHHLADAKKLQDKMKK